MRPRGHPSDAGLGRLAEATRIATLLTADPERGPGVAEEALAAALQIVPRRRREARLGDVLLAQLVRRARVEGTAPDDLPAQLAALRLLPRRQRAALVLRHYADLPDERAAFFLDCSARTVADLARRAERALPAEARTDVREWLDSAPLPRPVPSAHGPSLRRRILQPRTLRAAGALTAVAVGIVAGVRIPAALREAEPPTREERLAQIRQVLETREAALPFDPDDAGPGASPMFPVVDGVVGGSLWNITAYRDAEGKPCLQLVVAYEFGARRCVGAERDAISAVVHVDRAHGVTFISGMVSPRVEELYFTGLGVSWMDVAIGRENPESEAPQPGFFGIALPQELVPVAPRESALENSYDVMRGRLTAVLAGGKRVTDVSILLAKA